MNDIPSKLASLVAQMKETTKSGTEYLVELRDQVRELVELLEGRPVSNFADRLNRTVANVARRVSDRGRPDLSNSPFRTAVVSVADRIARLGRDWAASLQAEARLAGAFHGLDREIVDLSQKLGGGFPLGLGDETRYNFGGGGKYLTLAEWVHSNALSA